VRRFEIGYWIRQSASRQGFMSEAVDRVTQFAFKNLQANRIEIRCDCISSMNEASVRLSRKHFPYDGPLCWSQVFLK